MTTSRLFYQSTGSLPQLDYADGVYMWDNTGKQYLDGSSGAMVSNIGHSNPNVLAAMRRQMEKSTFGYRLHFETEAAEALATKIDALSTSDLQRVFFTSGGSEAVESCLKIARQYAIAIGQASRWKVISLSPSYHGSTFGALAITGYDPLSVPFEPMMKSMPKIPSPRAYLDKLDPQDVRTGYYYADMLEACIVKEGMDSVLAFIVEPIGGASTGALVHPNGYMARIRQICDRYGVLLIHDEVMSGAGRTGRFFGAEHAGVKPDLIALSKGLGAGYVPLGAMIANQIIVDTVLASGGFAHGFTYAGNPLACSAGLAVINEIQTQGLLANATDMGQLLKHRLTALMDRYQCIGDVRGEGLLLAFELVSERENMTPLPVELNAGERLVRLAYEHGLIVYTRRTRGGIQGEHIMVCPPMIITAEQVDELISRLNDALAAFCRELNPITAKACL